MSCSRRSNVLVVALALVLAVFALTTNGCLRRETRDQDRMVDEFEGEPDISLYVNETGETRHMKIEEYIAGVVAGEMLPDWPVNAYAAQAILARTFTLAKMSEGGMRDKYGTDMSTDKEETQAYDPESVTDAIRDAVASTRGMILSYKGQYVRGWFHAASGGQTTLAKDGLAYEDDEPSYTKSVEVPAELRHIPREELNWEATYSLSEITSLLNAAGHSVGQVQRVFVVEKDQTGRATLIRVEHTGGHIDLPGAVFRNAVGPDRMRSTLLTRFDSSATEVQMAGRGFGHGVGMSQWGAYGMSREGYSPEEIVKYFFKDVETQKLWD